MKKIKVMFTAIAILAVVGGALAFKAKKLGQGSIYCEDEFAKCTRLVDFVPTTGSGTDDPCNTGDKRFGTAPDPEHWCPVQNIIVTTTAL